MKYCPRYTSSFNEDTGECDGPPPHCRPDCFGSDPNPMLEWSAWGPWNTIYEGTTMNIQERFRYPKNCQHFDFSNTQMRQERRVEKRGRRALFWFTLVSLLFTT